MKRERRTNETPWTCTCCNYFQAISLRTLLNHYNKVHGHETNFRVVCNVDDCPAIFTKYNSLYKHITRCHEDVYNETVKGNSDVDNTEDKVNDDGDLFDYNLRLYNEISDKDSSDSEELWEANMAEKQVYTYQLFPFHIK